MLKLSAFYSKKVPGRPANQNTSNRQPQNGTPASPKQIKYLLDLGRNPGWTPQQIAATAESIYSFPGDDLF